MTRSPVVTINCQWSTVALMWMLGALVNFVSPPAPVIVEARVITFTGNATLDFPANADGVFVVLDTPGDVDLSGTAGTIPFTGWDIHDARFAYDVANDTAYIGECHVDIIDVPGWQAQPGRQPQLPGPA